MARISVTGPSAVRRADVARGETHDDVALEGLIWDAMAELPILGNLGISRTIDWERTDLRSKLRFACGSARLLEKVRPLLTRVAGTA